jgi:hypothetical protein
MIVWAVPDTGFSRMQKKILMELQFRSDTPYRLTRLSLYFRIEAALRSASDTK